MRAFALALLLTASVVLAALYFGPKERECLNWQVELKRMYDIRVKRYLEVETAVCQEWKNEKG